MGSDPGSPLPPGRDWYVNGNYLVILVSVTIILPLALMRQLGEHGGVGASGGRVGRTSDGGPQAHGRPFPHSAGYLGYSSGFSLSCMVFFLIAVSASPCWWRRGRGGGAGVLRAPRSEGSSSGPDLGCGFRVTSWAAAPCPETLTAPTRSSTRSSRCPARSPPTQPTSQATSASCSSAGRRRRP